MKEGSKIRKEGKENNEVNKQWLERKKGKEGRFVFSYFSFKNNCKNNHVCWHTCQSTIQMIFYACTTFFVLHYIYSGYWASLNNTGLLCNMGLHGPLTYEHMQHYKSYINIIHIYMHTICAWDAKMTIHSIYVLDRGLA